MMGGNFFGVVIGFYHDPREEQTSIPASPTPVTFPPWGDGNKTSNWNEIQAPDLYEYFSRLHKITEVRQIHFDILNITTEAPCSIHELIPNGPNGTQFVPPFISEDVMEGLDHSDQRAFAGSKQYKDIVHELRVDNDLAYQIVTGVRPSMRRPPRLAYMRRFFAHLERMSTYWDTSLDHYYEIDEASQTAEHPSKRQKTDSPAEEEDGSEETECTRSSTNATVDEPSKDPSVTSIEPHPGFTVCIQNIPPPDVPTTSSFSPSVTPSASPSPPPPSRRRYKGRRLETGSDMKPSLRNDTASAFIDSILQSFRVTQRPPPVFGRPQTLIGNLQLPARLTTTLYLLPKDRPRSRVRAGTKLEGPILGLSSRPELFFEDADGTPDEAKCRLDRLREINALLHLAQARRREGKEFVAPGQGQWWTERPRWGGGGASRNEDEQAPEHDEKVLEETEDTTGGETRKKQGSKKDRRKSDDDMKSYRMMCWRRVMCGTGCWDSEAIYRAIGKDPASEFDTVFLFSCLNHHISILKMTVHEAYIDFLLNRKPPESPPRDPSWCSPKIQRTQWFDLFDLEQRELLFRGLWGVMEYQLRNEEGLPFRG